MVEKEDIVLEFTEEETQEIEQHCTEVIEHLPALIQSLSSDIATDILAELKQGWQAELKRQMRERAGFERRLYQRWGLPLGLLRMLLTISQEYGASVNQELRESSASSPTYLRH